jgi:hypothetical protein
MPLTGLPGPAAAAIAPTPCRQLAPIVWMGPGKTRREDAWTSRRGFLRTIGLAAGPLLIPASALGRTGRPAPADRLNLGVIGLGMMGQGHVSNCLNLPSVQLVAVCDVDRTRLEDVRRLVDSSYAVATHSGEYQGCSAYADFRELLARDDLDAVWVATPDH